MITASTLVNSSKEAVTKALWESDPAIYDILKKVIDLPTAREMIFAYLDSLDRHYFNVYSPRYSASHHIIERNNARECIRVLKNIFRTENEMLSSFSALKRLLEIAQNKEEMLEKTEKGFLCEFLYLFRGINGDAGIANLFTAEEFNTDNPQERSKELDNYARVMHSRFRQFRTGTDQVVSRSRFELRSRILQHYGASEDNWNDYRWHLKHIFRDAEEIGKFVELENDEIKGLKEAKATGISVQITPYYLTLFSSPGRTLHDRAARAQVIPGVNYCRTIAKNRECGMDNDFMGEKTTSPIENVTRRYPQIVILKPFDSCPQICVYCQRNWEITDIEESSLNQNRINRAIEWIRENDSITEVLVTGGDPLTLDNKIIDDILNKISSIQRIERIRIGTRVPVTLPMRIDKELIDILYRYHEWGKREISIMTHVESTGELTDELTGAVKSIKQAGINIYNQQVFTYYNSRRFETSFLRKSLKLCGIDPYYLFNTKGKEETDDFRVPIARIEQERKEEARLLPGLARTDESVFNVPRLGKSHLRAWQDHEPVMVLPDGKRIYRFYPWESKISLTDDYLYTDVPIYNYLQRLAADGEDVDEYESIWYYF